MSEGVSPGRARLRLQREGSLGRAWLEDMPTAGSMQSPLGCAGLARDTLLQTGMRPSAALTRVLVCLKAPRAAGVGGISWVRDPSSPVCFLTGHMMVSKNHNQGVGWESRGQSTAVVFPVGAPGTELEGKKAGPPESRYSPSHPALSHLRSPPSRTEP